MLKENNSVDISTDDKLAIMDFIKANQVITHSAKNIEFELFEKLKQLSIPLDVFYKVTGTRPIDVNSKGYEILFLCHLPFKMISIFVLGLCFMLHPSVTI